MNCDFCNDTNPRWEYPAEDFVTDFGVGSEGSWSACDACHALIERGDRVGVTVRSVTRIMAESFPGASPDDVEWKMIAVVIGDHLVEAHARFFACRTGPSRPIASC